MLRRNSGCDRSRIACAERRRPGSRTAEPPGKGRREAAGIGSTAGARAAQQLGRCMARMRGMERWRSRPISRVLSWTVIPLGAASPLRSSSLPGADAGRVIGSLFGLAPGGVCRAGLLPGSRCALTAPFHPCHARLATDRSAVSFCCTFRRLAPPRRYLAPCPVEPGLSSAPLACATDDATVWPTPPRALSHAPHVGGLTRRRTAPCAARR